MTLCCRALRNDVDVAVLVSACSARIVTTLFVSTAVTTLAGAVEYFYTSVHLTGWRGRSAIVVLMHNEFCVNGQPFAYHYFYYEY